MSYEPGSPLRMLDGALAQAHYWAQLHYAANQYAILCDDGRVYIPNQVEPVASLVTEGIRHVIGADYHAGTDSFLVQTTITGHHDNEALAALMKRLALLTGRTWYIARTGTYRHYKGGAYSMTGIRFDTALDVPAYDYHPLGNEFQQYSRLGHVWFSKSPEGEDRFIRIGDDHA